MKKIILLLLLVIVHKTAGAQINTMTNAYANQFRSEIHQISQFINCFNAKDAPGIQNGSSRNRMACLARLLDWGDTSFIYSSELREFTNIFVKDPAHAVLNYTDSNWFSIVNCTFKYNDHMLSMQLIMNMKTDENGSGWMLEEVHCKSLFWPFITNNQAKKKISPLNNEVGFPELLRTFKNKDDIAGYVRTGSIDTLGIFLAEVSAGILNLKSIDSIEYSFNTNLGWNMRVKKINRISPNSGWLISNVSKIK